MCMYIYIHTYYCGEINEMNDNSYFKILDYLRLILYAYMCELYFFKYETFNQQIILINKLYILII